MSSYKHNNFSHYRNNNISNLRNEQNLDQIHPPFQGEYRDQYSANSYYSSDNSVSNNIEQFRGQISQICDYANTRNMIINLFSGQKNHEWVLQEIIQCMGKLVQFNAGAIFISSIHHKLLFRSKEWSDSLFRFFPQLLMFQSSYEMFHTLLTEIPNECVQNFALCCFDQFMRGYSNDMELISLISAVIQLISKSYPNLYSGLCNLQLFLSRPQTILVGRTLIEYGNKNTICRFQDEIESQILEIIKYPEPSELVSSLLMSGTRIRRNRIYKVLQPLFPSMIFHQFQWKILYTLLCTGTMEQKICITYEILKSLNYQNKLPHIDILLRHALESIDIRTRMIILKSNQSLTCDQQLPCVANYLLDLSRMKDHTI